jgi:hypothetical protein
MSLIVQRLPGDRPADGIVSAILTDDISKIHRGTQFINANDSDRALSTATLVKKSIPDYNVPILVNTREGEIVGGILTGIEFNMLLTPDSLQIQTSIETERLSDG